MVVLKVLLSSCLLDEMDCGVEQIDGPSRTSSPSCEQLDAGREGEKDADARRRGDICRPRIKLPQRSDMICGFASLKGQKICKLFCYFCIGNVEMRYLTVDRRMNKASRWPCATSVVHKLTGSNSFLFLSTFSGHSSFCVKTIKIFVALTL